MSSNTKAKRRARIERRGSPELVQAMREGFVSVRTADRLFYLPAQEQAAQLRRRLSAIRAKEERSKAAAATIRAYLNTHERVDLGEFGCLLRQALSTG